jgi:hypothetical protein
MTGDQPDVVSRLKSTLPTRWFPDETPVLDALLTGLAAAWSSLYSLLATVRLQSRVATATGMSLDGASADFFGPRLPRGATENDDAFRSRIGIALTREHATRAALSAALLQLTGHTPVIFEAARVADTGAYGGPAFGYGVAGAWGSLALPFQVFITARRPTSSGIANVAGYGTAGPLDRANLSQISGQVTDSDISAAITAVIPTATIAWTRITN